MKDQEDSGLRGLASGSGDGPIIEVSTGFLGNPTLIHRATFADWLKRAYNLEDVPEESIEASPSPLSKNSYTISFEATAHRPGFLADFVDGNLSRGRVRCTLRIFFHNEDSADKKTGSFAVRNCSMDMDDNYTLVQGDVQEAGIDKE